MKTKTVVLLVLAVMTNAVMAYAGGNECFSSDGKAQCAVTSIEYRATTSNYVKAQIEGSPRCQYVMFKEGYNGTTSDQVRALTAILLTAQTTGRMIKFYRLTPESDSVCYARQLFIE